MNREPDNPAHPAIPETIAQAAAEWVMRCDRGLNRLEERALAKWLAADPDHKAEYVRLTGQWKDLDSLKAEPSLSAMADVIVARAKNRRSRRKQYFQVAVLGLAAAAAVAIILVRPPNPPAAQDPALASVPIPVPAAVKHYVVRASTAHRMDLPDGSVAELNGDSRIEVNFTRTVRQVKLLKGEVLFSVAKNPECPFVVSAGPVSVRAVGTAFNVVLAAGSVQVLVTEGKVRLGNVETPTASVPASAPMEAALVAGERAVVQTSAPADTQVLIETPVASEIERALAWKSTQLVFDHTPLDEVVTAFNLYNTHHLVLADPSLKSRTISGSFSAENLDGFTRLLRAIVDVVAKPRGDDQILLRPAP